MQQPKKQFAICVGNEGAEDLETRKIYQILPHTRTKMGGFRLPLARL